MFKLDSILDLATNIHFEKFLKQIESYNNIDIVCEQQFIKRNMVLGGFICGIICDKIKVNKIFSFPPFLKSKSALNYGFDYKKVKSNMFYNIIP